MVVLVGGNDKERIVLGDPVLGEAVEELAECFVVRLELHNVAGFSGAEGSLDTGRDA